MAAEPSQRELPFGHKVQCAESGLPGSLMVKCKYSWREIFFLYFWRYLIVSTRQWSSGKGTGKIMKTYRTMIIFGSQAKNLNNNNRLENN
jgi:hypothetical protein